MTATLVTGESFAYYNSPGDQYSRKGGMSCTNESSSLVSGIYAGTKGASGSFNRVLDTPVTTINVEFRGIPEGNNVTSFSLLNSATQRTKLTFSFDSRRGSVAVYSGDISSLIHNCPNNVYATSEVGWWGITATIDPSAGSIYLYYGNVLVWSDTGLNTTGDDDTTVVDTLGWATIQGSWNLVQDILVSSGGLQGDTLMLGNSPTANGTENDFSAYPSGPNVDNVDNATFQTARYNFSSTTGNKEFYKWGSPPSGNILGVILGLYCWQDTGGGTRQIQPAVSNGTTEYDGSSIVLGSNSPLLYTTTYTENPTTSAPWAQADFTAGSGYTELGLKLAA